MIGISGLRKWAFTFRKKLFRQIHTFRVKPVFHGLPETISHDTLDRLCQDHFSSHLQDASHQHLSAWKSTGAYRLLLKLSNGSEVSLILKEANYDVQEVPALVGLRVNLGEAEYCIYSQAEGPVKPFLPGVFLAERIIPGIRYRYILEDLASGYERIGTEKALIKASALLPRLHDALRAWAGEANTDGLIQYGQGFSRSLQAYARINLDQIQAYVDDPVFHSVFQHWQEITDLHLQPEFFQFDREQPVHGDSNFTNIHISLARPDHIKLVDWEWAGLGSSFSDIVSLTKGASEKTGQMALQSFRRSLDRVSSHPQTGRTEEINRRQYDWCQLERGMLDAAFLAAQYLHADRQANFNLPKAVCSSLKRMHGAYLRLAG